MEGQSLGTSSQFDTFGLTAADHARKHAEKEQQKRLMLIMCDRCLLDIHVGQLDD